MAKVKVCTCLRLSSLDPRASREDGPSSKRPSTAGGGVRVRRERSSGCYLARTKISRREPLTVPRFATSLTMVSLPSRSGSRLWFGPVPALWSRGPASPRGTLCRAHGPSVSRPPESSPTGDRSRGPRSGSPGVGVGGSSGPVDPQRVGRRLLRGSRDEWVGGRPPENGPPTPWW